MRVANRNPVLRMKAKLDKGTEHLETGTFTYKRLQLKSAESLTDDPVAEQT